MAAVGPGRRPSPRPPLLFSTSSLVGSLPLDFVRLQLRETGRQQQQQAKEKFGGERRGAGGLVEESRLGHDSAPKATTATMDDDTLKVEMFFFFSFFFLLHVDPWRIDRPSNRTSSSNENHFEMCINPHDMEAEFQSDEERQNSDGGGNIEFVR